MHRTGHRDTVSWGLVGTAFVLLLGILILTTWPFRHDRLAFDVGLLVTACGVIAGVQQLVVHPKR